MAKRDEQPYTIEDVRAALTILAGYTPARLAEARREHFEAWATGFERDGVEAPEWID